MADKSRNLLLSKRNILGATLVAGIGLGIYLGKFAGFGNGGNGFFGFTPPKGGTIDDSKSDGDSKSIPETPDETEIVGVEPLKATAEFVQVVIEEHDYLLKNETNETPVKLEHLIELVKKAPGDTHGVRLRVTEKGSARVKAEEDLKTALKAAEIPESAVIWVPPAIAK